MTCLPYRRLSVKLTLNIVRQTSKKEVAATASELLEKFGIHNLNQYIIEPSAF